MSFVTVRTAAYFPSFKPEGGPAIVCGPTGRSPEYTDTKVLPASCNVEPCRRTRELELEGGVVGRAVTVR